MREAQVEQDAAVQQRLVLLRTTLLGFPKCAESYRRLYHYLPAAGSPAAREIDGAGRLEDAVKDTLSIAAIVLGGAQDHLVGLACLLDAESSVYAPRTVARGLLEGAARAWWLLDPAIDARERVARTLTERLYSLLERAKAERTMSNGTGQAAQTRIDYLIDLAERRYGFVVLRDQKQQRPLAVEATRPTSTELVGRLLMREGTHTEFGEVAYRLYSGATHGALWSLMSGLIPEPDPAGKHEFIAYLRLTLNDAELLVAITAMAFGEAFNREVDFYGWDRREWDAYARRALVDLRSTVQASQLTTA
jgi:hypothetical protein